MASPKFITKCLLLLCVILCAESTRNSKKNANILCNLFKCIGWKNLNRVINVTYLTKEFDLPSIMQEPITSIDCNTKIRAATVFLGCTYASILIDILTAVNYQRLFCNKIMSNEFDKIQGYNCTVKLLKIICNITLFTKKMHGALYAIDKLHTNPWQLLEKYSIILSFISRDFQNLQSQLNNSCPSREDLTYNKTILYNIRLKISNIVKKIEFNINQYCTLEKCNMFVITEKLNTKYENIYLNEKNISFYYFGSEIILNGIEMLILDNFTKLGFEFNSDSGETFIPRSLVHLFKEGDNESKTSPVTIPMFYDFFQKETKNESKTSLDKIPIFYDFLQKETKNEFNTSPATIPVFYDFLQKEAVNESETSPATNPDCYDFLQKEAINEPETSLATNPVFYDFLQKEEAVNKSETSLAMNPAYYDFLQKETNNDSNTPPGTAPTYDFLQKEAVNELETSQATNPVFYDFLQKDLIGDTIMNEETDIEKGELTKKYPQHFIKFL
ncbi:uncharacterized protein LOC126899396 isoform X29 [Daktulosphaira vitifoliae]|uniref:uncharacterized protein LOC126899396 isoform X29 n=1 Tax=Daktulosphaira vitifoliae TaxID=58002 RepID=UPI0021AAD936|nr:uncharacterized protein LOC126899396 isoform X29 [Daktulosphaira vitifoliae]